MKSGHYFRRQLTSRIFLGLSVAATLFGRGCPVACLDNAYGLIQP